MQKWVSFLCCEITEAKDNCILKIQILFQPVYWSNGQYVCPKSLVLDFRHIIPRYLLRLMYNYGNSYSSCIVGARRKISTIVFSLFFSLSLSVVGSYLRLLEVRTLFEAMTGPTAFINSLLRFSAIFLNRNENTKRSVRNLGFHFIITLIISRKTWLMTLGTNGHWLRIQTRGGGTETQA